MRIIGNGPFLANKMEHCFGKVKVHIPNVFIGLHFSLWNPVEWTKHNNKLLSGEESYKHLAWVAVARIQATFMTSHRAVFEDLVVGHTVSVVEQTK